MRRNSAGCGRHDDDCGVSTDPNTPVSFRLAKEEDLERDSYEQGAGRVRDCTFGVQSLADTIHDTFGPKKNDKSEESPHGGRRRSTLKPVPFPSMKDHAQGSLEEANVTTANSSPSRSGQEGPSPPSLSHSLTSLSLDSQAPSSSLPSTPKSTSNRSFRQSDEESMDDGVSQAVVSSDDDEAELQPAIPDIAPQLIMPSLKMPSQRPYTDRGKAMGRLKVLVAGDSGVGKTSLIKSIVQLCEDIVHVDPLSPKTHSLEKQPCGKLKGRRDSLKVKATQQVTEVYASTKPYPSWWSDIENTEVLRRRKSVGDVVLDRNLCFVDTPPCYSKGISRTENMRSVLQYIESQLTKPFSATTASEGDIAGLLSGNGGFQVDVVFYLVARVLKDEDVAFLQRLTAISNVIPLIGKADLQSFEEVEVLKRSIADSQNSFFTFNSDNAIQSYTISSATADDAETMDASTLMSPDYVQPLIPSELADLIQLIFNPENMACLRHLSAKKLVQAQGFKMFGISDQSRLTDPPTSPISSPNTSRTLISRHGGLSPYTHARISDHMQQEERLGQVRLAKWASDLQRSLRNERARYEAIARNERAVWLNERLGETVSEGALIPMDTRKSTAANHDVWRAPGHRGLLDAGDPLGLLRWNEIVKRKVWIIPIGLLGVIWMVRTWGEGSHSCAPWSWGWSW